MIYEQERNVCNLYKSIYGLKQSPTKWHEKFDNLIMSDDFRFNESVKCIYYKFENDICTLIWLYLV